LYGRRRFPFEDVWEHRGGRSLERDSTSSAWMKTGPPISRRFPTTLSRIASCASEWAPGEQVPRKRRRLLLTSPFPVENASTDLAGGPVWRDDGGPAVLPAFGAVLSDDNAIRTLEIVERILAEVLAALATVLAVVLAANQSPLEVRVQQPA
jgi:hypothetical protein